MSESERLQRYQQHLRDYCDSSYDDSILEQRIVDLLNHPDIDRFCLVDAYYYDFSVIPREIQQKNNFYRDMYLLYGITNSGEMVTKWVERWDLDSDDEIVNGVVIVKPRIMEYEMYNKPPEIKMQFNPLLLQTPTFNLFRTKDKDEVV